ncbi:hypothetical protein PybrP1_013015 [[Pythium] brassicae (nom. inval.)]|nr:hypothetical protein PybrP1_013015 [[Pythium] brassicae (nom. inval.)]
MLVDCRFAVLARVPVDLQRAGHQSFALDPPSLYREGRGDDLDNAETWTSCNVVDLLRGADLVVALSPEHLVVLARTTRDLSCSCRRNLPSKLLAAGFHCPHLVGLADLCYVAAIPVRVISQVLITYRTQPPTKTATASTEPSSGSGVAARTKELVLALRDGGHVWLEFEHNLARGMFLDALTTSAAAATTPSDAGRIDVDYVDLNDVVSTFPVAASELALAAFPASSLEIADARATGSASRLADDVASDTGDARFAFVRDALRHVVYGKVHLALQASRESASGSEDPATGLLLRTATELSQTLDEPDLVAFAWLSSAAITFRSGGATAAATDTSQLALTQAMRSVDIARENGFPYLLSLGLHCAADLQLKDGNAAVAKDHLVAAARLTPDGVEAGLKMQLHRKIHALRDRVDEAQTTRTLTLAKSTQMTLGTTEVPTFSSADPPSKLSSSGIKQRERNLFSLWDHNASARFKELLLHKVLKLPALSDIPPHSRSPNPSLHGLRAGKRSASCYVDVMMQQQRECAQPDHKIFGVDSVVQSPRTRLRVFFDCLETVEWLRCEVVRRLRSTVCSEVNTRESATIEGFWELDSNRRQWQRIEWVGQLGAIVLLDDQVLVATLGSASARGVTGTPAVQQPQQQRQQTPEEQHAQVGSQATQLQDALLLTLTCSVCHACVLLEDAEAHSDTCY